MSENDQRRTPFASEDLALLRRVLDGKRPELQVLAERLRCVARILEALDLKHGRQLGPDGLADLSQDVLVLVWRKLGEFEGHSSLEGWTYGICVLEYQNAVRRKRRLRQEAQVLASRGGVVEDAARDPDPWRFEEVHEGLRRIGREESQVIRMKHFEGRTFDEIGRALELSPNTVKARYYRGLEELRPLLEGGE